MGEHRKAEFTEEIREQPGLMSNDVVTKCWCGWETTARNSSLYGQDGALNDAMLHHRIAHIEEAVFDD